MKIIYISVWMIAGMLLVYDGIFDAVTSTNHMPCFDIAEFIIGAVILILLFKYTYPHKTQEV
jgi:hypothetical protein